MLRNLFFALGLSAIGCLTLADAGSAQTTDASELSAERMEELFQKQKTRGLVLAPTNEQGTAAGDTEAAAAGSAETYVQLEPDEQVNIRIAFDYDSSALREDQKPKLATLCQVMQNVDVEVFRIVGHTDAAGSASYNEGLSLLRAQEVKRHLVTDCGIDATRLQAVGVGLQFPLEGTDPYADENRRVEFQALS